MDFLFLVSVTGVLLGGLNYYLYRKARRLVLRWHPEESGVRWVGRLRIGFLLMNAPFASLLALWMAGFRLHQVPRPILLAYFYPFYAWVLMLVAFVLVAFPAELLAGAFHAARWLWRQAAARLRSMPASVPEALPAHALARRNFLASTAAVVPATLFALSARAVYGSDDLEVSPLVKVPIRGLPRPFDGFTITQISDLHTGAYIRARELARAVEVANSLRSELLVITGDILDSSLDLLPTAASELGRLRAPLGVYGILGNHDYYADRRARQYPGCVRILQGMEAAGVRMLRNQRAALRLGGEELLLLGLDWTGTARGNPNVYMGRATRDALERTLAGYEGAAPRILLAHHPHVFYEAPEFSIHLTLAGHTHGGGQIVIAEHNGRPLALGSGVFRYLSGLYREGSHYLYVNRGIGVVGIPVRIQCPPEISRFQLVRA